MKIRIGKAADNDFVIDDPQVSRYHAQLTRDEKGNLLLDDLGSTNGTFVNDCQIVRKYVSAADGITFGANYTLTVNDILKRDNDYSEEFARLKNVYDEYIREKIRVQSSNQFKTRLFQSLPFAVVGVAGIVLGFMGHTNKGVFIFSFILAVLAPTIGIYFGARQAAKIPAQLQRLAHQFKIDYVCPKCGTFLGEIPWESLSNKKRCPVSACRAKWIRT
ncbi:MAG: FHA domain-containing protein [Tannerella sp.]|jgi:pSer/pThr/pTyr-binding forkhead associated (FHA) protein|nr:FHA domain-containing protein [Tannerella sp.]